MRSSLLTSCLCLFSACGNAATQSPDSGPSASDAAEPTCSERLPLSIGHCLDTATDEPCLDFEAETRAFVELEGSAPVRPIIGLQGSPMFVLAVQAEGIHNGENEFAPMVDLKVTNGDEFVGGYAARPLFIEGSPSGVLRAPQLYVVSFFADEQVGLTVDVQAEIVDQSGQQWCHTGSFEIGELVEAPPLP